MRHGRKVNHLSRTSSHRKAMLSNMATSLILHKRIETTVAKAKALRGYIDPLITKSKENTTHSRRLVFSKLKSKEAIKELFGEVAGKIATRPGGYTRIIRIGNRLGDNAETCMMELVDYNEVYTNEKKAKAGTGKKRTRRGKGGAKAEEAPETGAKAAVAETPVEEKKPKAEKKTEEPKAEHKPVAEHKAPKAEKKAEEPKKEEKPAAEEGEKK